MTVRKFVSLAAAFALGAGTMAIAGRPASAAGGQAKDVYRWLESLGATLDTVERQYVKPVDSVVLAQAAMEGLLTSLDPHSSYLPPQDLVAEGEAPVGVGMSLTRGGQGLTIELAQADGPAARAGARAGDALVAVDGQQVGDLSPSAAARRLRGPEASIAVLTLARGGVPLILEVKREKIATPPGVSSRMIGETGYLALTNLEPGTSDQVAAAVAALRAQNPKMGGLVLDLRKSPGGRLDQSVGVTSDFIDTGVVFSQQGRDPKAVERYNARGGDRLQGLPLVVLVGPGTAAGAEIIAAALQDHGRAKLVGLPTFGSGSIQTVIPLRNGRDGAIRMTTAFFYRPSGAPIQKVGVTPDIIVAQGAPEADGPPFREASLAGALDAPGEAPAPRPAVKPERPPAGFDTRAGDYQLTRALALVRGAS